MRVVRAARLEPAREFLQSEPLGADKWGLVFPNKEQKEQALPSIFQQRERRFDHVLNPVSVSPACGFYFHFSLAEAGSEERRICSVSRRKPGDSSQVG